MDDCSRVTWIYLINFRSEVFSMFKIFYSKIKNQFSNIKILRFKYLDNYFNKFLEQNEILHRSSCVYTPQKKGVVELKNRHILDIARTLLFYRQVPKEFWG